MKSRETGKIISIYDSATEAARINNFHQGNICWCCNGRRNEANGYKWKYIDKEQPLGATFYISPIEALGDASYFYANNWSVDQTLNSRFVADGYTPKTT